MELMSYNLDTQLYIQSEAEFHQARRQGIIEQVLSFFTGRSSRLCPLKDMPASYQQGQSLLLGVQDILLEKIGGSVGRDSEYTRRFAPLNSDHHTKERWRKIYILALSGKGFPPIEVYKLGDDYFVEDGHHRLSVARYLGWKSIQARVIEFLPTPSSAYKEFLECNIISKPKAFGFQ